MKIKNILVGGISLSLLVFSNNVFADTLVSNSKKVRTVVLSDKEEKRNSWKGHYLGLSAAAMRVRYDLQANAFKQPADSPNTAVANITLAGAFIGYNIIGNDNIFVVGLEGYFDLAKREQITIRNNMLTLRRGGGAKLRVGYAMDKFLPYVALGIAYNALDIKIKEDFYRTRHLFGWSASFGLDYKLWQNVFVRAEYSFNSSWAGVDNIANAQNKANKAALAASLLDRQELRLGIGINY
ncbi:outer membrane protein [Bartonella sp. DGB1]|uniref:outer membrane protein n=1 Tax=Bartonella sp. DGB1 TaxID=3239807 RepID=UPI003525112F